MRGEVGEGGAASEEVCGRSEVGRWVGWASWVGWVRELEGW